MNTVEDILALTEADLTAMGQAANVELQVRIAISFYRFASWMSQHEDEIHRQMPSYGERFVAEQMRTWENNQEGAFTMILEAAEMLDGYRYHLETTSTNRERQAVEDELELIRQLRDEVGIVLLDATLVRGNAGQDAAEA